MNPVRSLEFPQGLEFLAAYNGHLDTILEAGGQKPGQIDDQLLKQVKDSQSASKFAPVSALNYSDMPLKRVDACRDIAIGIDKITSAMMETAEGFKKLAELNKKEVSYLIPGRDEESKGLRDELIQANAEKIKAIPKGIEHAAQVNAKAKLIQKALPKAPKNVKSYCSDTLQRILANVVVAASAVIITAKVYSQ